MEIVPNYKENVHKKVKYYYYSVTQVYSGKNSLQASSNHLLNPKYFQL